MDQGYSLTVAWRRCDALMKSRVGDFCKQHGLRYVDRIIMDTLYDLGSCCKKDLSQHLMTVPESLTRALSRLTQSKLIKLHPHHTDKRSSILSLSPHGAKLTRALRSYTANIWAEMLDDLPINKKKYFTEALLHMSNKKI